MQPHTSPRPLVLVAEPPRAGQPSEALARLWREIEWLVEGEIKRAERAPAFVEVERLANVRYGKD